MAKSENNSLDPLFTDGANEYGPVGNDTGHDVFAHYQKWRSGGKPRGQFIVNLLASWEIGDYDWDDEDMDVIIDEMERSKKALFERLTRDDVIIALAVAQIIVDGAPQPTVLERALKAVWRQSHERMIEFRGWDNPKYRKEVLKKVAAFIESSRPNS